MLYAILATVIILALVCAWALPKHKKLVESGTIAERKMRFWENAQVFSTVCTYDTIAKSIGSAEAALSQHGVEVGYSADKQLIGFRSGDSWKAIMESKGMQDGKNLFQFSFTSWRARNGIPYGSLEMNVTLTAVEKAILSSDPQATVEMHKLQLKSK